MSAGFCPTTGAASTTCTARPGPRKPRLGQPARPLPHLRRRPGGRLAAARRCRHRLLRATCTSRCGRVRARPGLDTLAILFELALGLSAWKEYRGSRWALRCNPSSGNLHPTEGYAVLPPLPGIEAGVYHYVSRDHRLERRCASAEAADLRPCRRHSS